MFSFKNLDPKVQAILVLVFIYIVYVFYDKFKKYRERQNVIAPLPPEKKDIEGATQGTGAQNQQGYVISLSDDAIKKLAKDLKEKIEGFTWWSWDIDPRIERASNLSDYDLARLDVFYTILTGRSLASDLDEEQVGLFSPNGNAVRNLIKRLQNLKK